MCLCLVIIISFASGLQFPDEYPQSFFYQPVKPYPPYYIINHKPKTVIESKTDGSVEVPTIESIIESSTVSTLSEKEHTGEQDNVTSDIGSNTNNTTLEDISNSPLSTLDVSTDNTIYTPAEFPHDLLEIARTKLGLKSLDEVPSISELAEYLGTTNAEETLKYIRQLTSTEQGITLVKAYLESADFTDRTEEMRRRSKQHQNQIEMKELPPGKQEPKNNLLERIAAYFHIYNFWPQTNSDTPNATKEARKTIEQQLTKYIKPQLVYRKRLQSTSNTQHINPALAHHRPLLVRQPLPYHYPIPLRPIYDNQVVPTQNRPTTIFSHVHLNTPKFYVPHHIQLARAVNIPPEQLQSLLQSKPKLAELAAKANHLPLTNEHSGHINAQLLAALKRAVEQDEDLRRLLQSKAETLK